MSWVTAIPGARRFYGGVRRLGHRLRFWRDFYRFRRLSRERSPAPGRFPRWADRNPQLGEWTKTTGFDRHYVLHLAWAARVLRDTAPAEHVDVSSALYFCALVSAFVPVRFYDFRPADLNLRGLAAGRADLTRLPFPSGSILSLSCMHVVEHVGLGRYGDPLDPDGDLKAISELKRVLAPGGNLLFAAPVGRPRIQYNAHRIYSFRFLRSCFADLELKQCALVPDDPALGGLLSDPSEELCDEQRYGCGCFWFQRSEKELFPEEG